MQRQQLAHCCLVEQKHQYQRNYHFRLLLSFTKKMPELTCAELIKFTKEMTTIGSKCCQLGQDKLLPCAEENVSIFLILASVPETLTQNLLPPESKGLEQG